MQLSIFRKVLISQSTFEYLQGEYDVEPANVTRQNKHLHDKQIATFYVVPSRNRHVRMINIQIYH